MIKAKHIAGLVSLLAAVGCGSAFAQVQVAGCTGSQSQAKSNIVVPAGATAGAPVTGTPTFVMTAFNTGCSANVSLNYQEVNANTFYVAAASSKGNQSFAGNSAGGGTIVPNTTACPAAGCGTGDITSAFTYAATLTGS